MRWIVLDDLEQDPAVWVIVIMGAGDAAFASGADISQFAERRAPAEAIQVYETLTREAWDRFERVTKPVVAQIRGYCVGGGLGVALAVPCESWLTTPASGFRQRGLASDTSTSA